MEDINLSTFAIPFPPKKEIEEFSDWNENLHEDIPESAVKLTLETENTNFSFLVHKRIIIRLSSVISNLIKDTGGNNIIFNSQFNNEGQVLYQIIESFYKGGYVTITSFYLFVYIKYEFNFVDFKFSVFNHNLVQELEDFGLHHTIEEIIPLTCLKIWELDMEKYNKGETSYRERGIVTVYLMDEDFITFVENSLPTTFKFSDLNSHKCGYSLMQPIKRYNKLVYPELNNQEINYYIYLYNEVYYNGRMARYQSSKFRSVVLILDRYGNRRDETYEVEKIFPLSEVADSEHYNAIKLRNNLIEQLKNNTDRKRIQIQRELQRELDKVEYKIDSLIKEEKEAERKYEFYIRRMKLSDEKLRTLLDPRKIAQKELTAVQTKNRIEYFKKWLIRDLEAGISPREEKNYSNLFILSFPIRIIDLCLPNDHEFQFT